MILTCLNFLIVVRAIKGPIDWFETDLDIVESGDKSETFMIKGVHDLYIITIHHHQPETRLNCFTLHKLINKTPPAFQVGLGVDFPVEVQPANNNVAIEIHDDRLYMGIRSSKNHFASNQTQMIIVSAPLEFNQQLSFKWEHELTIEMDADMREPYFLSLPDRLVFYFFKAGTNPLAFEPDYIHRVEKINDNWSDEPEKVFGEGEVMWQVNYENGTYHASSYAGNHYTINLGEVDLRFNTSTDGLNWMPINNDKTIVYHGGISEVGWAYDLDGNVWGIGRNEDGDESGWGSRIFMAPADDLSDWQWTSEKSDPNIYESPKMFRHGNDIYLIARTDPDGTFYTERELDNTSLHHLIDLGAYSTRQHGTALYKLINGQLEKVFDLPGCGDNAFPSIVRLGPHKYLVANYTSPTSRCQGWSWIRGQVSPRGTGVYFTVIYFEQ